MPSAIAPSSEPRKMRTVIAGSSAQRLGSGRRLVQVQFVHLRQVFGFLHHHQFVVA